MKQNNNNWIEVNPTTEEMWNPEEQETIQGIYVSLKIKVGPNESNVYVLNTVDNKKVGVWGSRVLDDRFKEIPIGSEIKIEYLGEQRTKKGGRTYQNYKVFYRPLGIFKEVSKESISVVNEDEANEQFQTAYEDEQ